MLGLMIFPYHQSPIIRLNPGAPEAKPPRRQGTPVPPAQVEAVRRLVEESPLSFRAIARETGVSLACVSRLATRHDWERRHVQAPAPNPTSEQRQDARLARLSERIIGLTEEAVAFLQRTHITATTAEIQKAKRLLRLAHSVVGEERRGKGRRRGR